MGPHKRVQNAAETRIAREEMPVRVPYSQGSTRLEVIPSMLAKRPKVKRGFVQPSKTAKA